MCIQDKDSRRNRNYVKESYLKDHDFNAKIDFFFKRHYNFIQIELLHLVHHKTIDCTEVPVGLEEFIRQQNCLHFADLMDMIKRQDIFWICQERKKAKAENNIRLFWRLRTASKWLKDEDSIVSARKLLRDNDLNYIKILDLDDNTNETIHKDYLAFSFEYLHIEKSLFRSAGVDATFNLRENLKQCFVIVGEFNCEGYPLAAVFSEEDNGGQVFLSKYVSKVSDMGYDFKYITTDMASTNVIDINKAFPMPQSNSAFGMLTKLYLERHQLMKMKEPKNPHILGF